MSIYQNGTFNGRVTDYGIGETKNGDPHVYVTFDVEFPGGVQAMTWKGWLHTEKSQPTTFKALQALGFNGKVSDLLDGPDGKAIAVGVPAKLVVENEPFKGDDGAMRDYYKIQWVNSANGGGGSTVQRADANTAKAALLKLGVDAAWMKHKQLNPTPAPPKVNDGDVPF